jgi:hypothetical protein
MENFPRPRRCFLLRHPIGHKPFDTPSVHPVLDDLDLGVVIVGHQCIFRITRNLSFTFSLIERSISIG